MLACGCTLRDGDRCEIPDVAEGSGKQSPVNVTASGGKEGGGGERGFRKSMMTT